MISSQPDTESSATSVAGGASPSGSPDRALLRLAGEISMKSRRTRRRFVNRLVDNLEDAFRSEGCTASVEAGWSRLYVEVDDPAGLDLLSRVFGLSSWSPIEGECEARLESIVQLGRELFAERVRGRRYAVRARRAGEHPFGSQDVERELGAALNPGAVVDLDDPDVTVRVEVRDAKAHLFADRVAGAGGLPLGVQSRAVALLSGGFDSAVAAWMALRRGVELDYVFCNLGGSAYRRMVLEVAKVLAERWSYGSRPRMFVLDFRPVVEEMRRSVKASHLQIVLKRLMYRCGSRIAEEVGGDAVITGESIGQVSSQTLANLRAIHDAATVPVLRPLVGFDKEEIIARSREIGTHDLSARVREYCAIAPDHPATASNPERARRQEDAVEPEVLAAALAEREELFLRDLPSAEIAGEALFIEEVADDAVVLDTRSDDAFEAWHWPGAERREFDELRRRFEELDPERTYVLCCEHGTRSASLAEAMQRAGYEAYAVRGGAVELRRIAAEAAEAAEPTR
ncbi:MAG: tRNA uracil 4-sulfurtransferase ThiI [Gemmatimonadota bacterium]